MPLQSFQMPKGLTLSHRYSSEEVDHVSVCGCAFESDSDGRDDEAVGWAENSASVACTALQYDKVDMVSLQAQYHVGELV